MVTDAFEDGTAPLRNKSNNSRSRELEPSVKVSRNVSQQISFHKKSDQNISKMNSIQLNSQKDDTSLFENLKTQKTHTSRLNDFYLTKERNHDFPSFSRLSSHDAGQQERGSDTSKTQFKDINEIKKKSEQLLAKSGVTR